MGRCRDAGRRGRRGSIGSTRMLTGCAVSRGYVLTGIGDTHAGATVTAADVGAKTVLPSFGHGSWRLGL
jgi:hypothetical protein